MRKVLISAMVGNALEWYDYALYGQMALILSVLFFPKSDPTVQLLATFGVFAAGFVVRPLGAILFGWIGDAYGRKAAMTIAVLMMAIPTGCIGLLPTYEQIGLLAPILLTVIRLLQGLSLGGEFAGSITYIVEHSPPHRRGLAGSASLVSLNIGFLMGSGVAWLFSTMLSPEDFQSWGWRIPFLFGIVIGFVGFYIRTHCDESPVYEKAKEEGTLSKKPVREAIARHPWEMLQAFGIYLTVTMPFYLSAIYFVTFTAKNLGRSMSEALLLNAANMMVMLVAFFVSALLSDRIGRRKIMMVMALLIFVTVHPLFALFENGDLNTIALVQVAFALMIGLYIGPVAALLVELFPTSVRYTGMAIAYNLAAAIFGGTTPMVCVWLIQKTGSNDSIAYYVMLCNVLSLIALWFYKDRYKEALR